MSIDPILAPIDPFEEGLLCAAEETVNVALDLLFQAATIPGDLDPEMRMFVRNLMNERVAEWQARFAEPLVVASTDAEPVKVMQAAAWQGKPVKVIDGFAEKMAKAKAMVAAVEAKLAEAKVTE